MISRLRQFGPEQLPLPLGHDTAQGAQDFLVAPSNRAAVDWIGRWPAWPAPTRVLGGPPGSGKTHLARVWQSRSGASAVDPAQIDLEEMARMAAAGSHILIDNCDRTAGDASSELALLQLYNLVRPAGGTMLLTARHPPASWPVGLPDLASRLGAALVATLETPDDDLLAAVAVKQFADRQLRVSPEVIPLLLARGERSFAGIGRAVDALDRRALANRVEITAALARAVLQELDREG